MWGNFVFLVIFDTCDVRIQLYWKCTNYTLPSIVLESICSDLSIHSLHWTFHSSSKCKYCHFLSLLIKVFFFIYLKIIKLIIIIELNPSCEHWLFLCYWVLVVYMSSVIQEREIQVSLVLLMSFFSSRLYDILLSEILLFK